MAALDKEGKLHYVTKTMEELEAMARNATDDDGFYSEANQRHLENMAQLDKEGKLNWTEHELIEA